MERRLAAIVAIDVVGYSRLMNKDEGGTHLAVKDTVKSLINPKVAQYRGRIVKLTGDGALFEFASAVDAVTFAVEMQCAMRERNCDVPEERRIEYRVGINIGDIFIEPEDIYGDGVNVAARLEGLSETGGICIARNVFNQVKGKLDLTFKPLGKQKVKNIEEAISIYRVNIDGKAEQLVTAVQTGGPDRKLQARYVAAAAALLLMAAGIVWWQPWARRVGDPSPGEPAISSSLPLPDKPSIAILPFANLSGDPQQEYFADGFTEDLITNIAQSKELLVIARNSTFKFKGRAVKIQQVAEELGVGYVLQGSLRRIGKNMRITVQLIDASNGAHVWAKRYDKPTAKLFDVQDEVSREIAGTLLVNISAADLAKSAQKRPKDLSAYDYVLRARAQIATHEKDATLEARALAEQAIAIDPDYAAAYATLGDTFILAYILQWAGPEALNLAYDAARKAVELDPLSSTAHELLGRVFLRRRQHDDAVATFERSIELNPNRSRNFASLADTLTFANRAKEAVELMHKAIRLDPFYSPLYNLYLGRAYYFSKRYDKAVAQLRTCAARAPKFRACYMYLAPTYAELGRQADAERTATTLLKISPNFSIATSVQKHLPFVPSAMQFYIRGLRKAGLPE